MKLPEKIKAQTITATGTDGVSSLVQSFLSVEHRKINEIIDYLQHLDNRIQTIANNQLEMNLGETSNTCPGCCWDIIDGRPQPVHIKGCREYQPVYREDTPKRWRAEQGEEYWFVRDYGDLATEKEGYDMVDDFRYYSGNYGKTEQEAQAYKEKLLEMGRNSN